MMFPNSKTCLIGKLEKQKNKKIVGVIPSWKSIPHHKNGKNQRRNHKSDTCRYGNSPDPPCSCQIPCRI